MAIATANARGGASKAMGRAKPRGLHQPLDIRVPIVVAQLPRVDAGELPRLPGSSDSRAYGSRSISSGITAES